MEVWSTVLNYFYGLLTLIGQESAENKNLLLWFSKEK